MEGHRRATCVALFCFLAERISAQDLGWRRVRSQPHFGQRLKDPWFTSSWTLAPLVLRLARYQPSIPTTLQTLASIVNLTMANNHNQDPNLIPALPHPDAYYESSFPLKDQYSAQRGDYQTEVHQEVRNGVLWKRCSRCRTWKIASENFLRHENKGYNWFRGWFYSKCIPCHDLDTHRKREYQHQKQQWIRELKQQGLLRYDDPDNAPIACVRCYKGPGHPHLTFSMKDDNTWFHTCDICQHLQTHRYARLLEERTANQLFVKLCLGCSSIKLRAQFVVETLSGPKVRALCEPCRPAAAVGQRRKTVEFFLKKQSEKEVVVEQHGCPGACEGFGCLFGFDRNDPHFEDNFAAMVHAFEYPTLAMDWHHFRDKNENVARITNDWLRALEQTQTHLTCKFDHRILTYLSKTTEILQNAMTNNLWRTNIKMQRLLQVGCAGPGRRVIRGLAVDNLRPQPEVRGQMECPFGFVLAVTLQDTVEDFVQNISDMSHAIHGTRAFGRYIFAKLFEIDEDPEFKMHNPGYENDPAAYTNMVNSNQIRCMGCHAGKTWNCEEYVSKCHIII